MPTKKWHRAQSSRRQDMMKVTIEEVNLNAIPFPIAQGRDRRQSWGLFDIDLTHAVGGHFPTPAVGEVWWIKRSIGSRWVLDHKVHPEREDSPGEFGDDFRAGVPNNVFLGFTVREKKNALTYQGFVTFDEVTTDVNNEPITVSHYIINWKPVTKEGSAIPFERIRQHLWNPNDAEIDDEDDPAGEYYVVLPGNIPRPKVWYWQARVRAVSNANLKGPWSDWTDPVLPFRVALPRPPYPDNIDLIFKWHDSHRETIFRMVTRFNDVNYWDIPGFDYEDDILKYRVQCQALQRLRPWAIGRDYPKGRAVLVGLDPVPEVQLITLTDFDGVDSFKLTFEGTESETTFIRGTNCTAADLEDELRDLTGDTNLTVSGTTDAGPFSVSWSETADQNMISVTSAVGCTGGVAETQTGDVGGNAYIASQAHTTSAENEPEVGADWQDYWFQVDTIIPNPSDGFVYCKADPQGDGEPWPIRRASVKDKDSGDGKSDDNWVDLGTLVGDLDGTTTIFNVDETGVVGLPEAGDGQTIIVLVDPGNGAVPDTGHKEKWLVYNRTLVAGNIYEYEVYRQFDGTPFKSHTDGVLLKWLKDPYRYRIQMGRVERPNTVYWRTRVRSMDRFNRRGPFSPWTTPELPFESIDWKVPLPKKLRAHIRIKEYQTHPRYSLVARFKDAAPDGWNLPGGDPEDDLDRYVVFAQALVPDVDGYIEGALIKPDDIDWTGQSGVHRMYRIPDRRVGEVALVINYESQVTNFTVGALLTGSMTGATATIISDTDAGPTGTLVLREESGVFEETETITDDSGGEATILSQGGEVNPADTTMTILLDDGLANSLVRQIDDDPDEAAFQLRIETPNPEEPTQVGNEVVAVTVVTEPTYVGDPVRTLTIERAQRGSGDHGHNAGDAVYLLIERTRRKVVHDRDEGDPGHFNEHYVVGLGNVPLATRLLWRVRARSIDGYGHRSAWTKWTNPINPGTDPDLIIDPPDYVALYFDRAHRRRWTRNRAIVEWAEVDYTAPDGDHEPDVTRYNVQLATSDGDQINAGIDDNDLAVVVNERRKAPSDVPFFILIDDEAVEVTARTLTGTWLDAKGRSHDQYTYTIVRAQKGTVAESHLANAHIFNYPFLHRAVSAKNDDDRNNYNRIVFERAHKWWFYKARVRAHDRFNRNSDWSDWTPEGTPSDDEPPPVPTDVEVDVDQHRVTTTWDYGVDPDDEDDADVPVPEIQVITLADFDTGDEFKLTAEGNETIAFVFGTNATAAAIQTELRTATGDTGLTVTGTTDVGPFTVTWSETTDQPLIDVTSEVGCVGWVVESQMGGNTAMEVPNTEVAFFQIQLSTVANFSTILRKDRYVLGTSKTWKIRKPGNVNKAGFKTYYVRVRAVDGSGNKSAWVGDNGNQNGVPTPQAPVLTYDANEVTKRIRALVLLEEGITHLDDDIEGYEFQLQPAENKRLTEVADVGETALDVTNTTNLPSTPFTAYIQKEHINVTGVGGSTFTVTRGYEGSTDVRHRNRARVQYFRQPAQADTGPRIRRKKTGTEAEETDPVLCIFLRVQKGRWYRARVRARNTRGVWGNWGKWSDEA